jgi:Zn-dependent protease
VPDFSLSSIFAKIVILLIAFPIHEFAHALVAYRLGDDTAARQGRLTLNPLAHLDPLGSLMLVFSFIGWAKPVPVNPTRLRFGPRVGQALVAAAGPASNLLMATFVAALWRVGVFRGATQSVVEFGLVFITINLALCLFNLIPLAPLDGSSVFAGLLGARGAAILAPLQTYGPLILMALLMIGFAVPQLNLIGRGINEGVISLTRLLLGL